MRTLLIASLLLGAACAGSSPPVKLSDEWPARASADDYDDIHEKWTRHGRDHADPDGKLEIAETIDVYATFKSPEWRAAYIAHRAELHAMPRSEVAALTKQAQEEMAQHYEVQLLVSTWDRRANDLNKGKRSTWRVALMDDQGHEIVADDIKRDRRPASEIKADYPDLGGFHTAYVARFPRTVDLLRPDARKFSLKVTSSQGGVTMTWSEK
ncbi:MAG TPA: hypothetical protein VMZ28_25405 [Kofleriaceae bacterium]|nr:hypothetical protein [Kofleriaceae bacterium]